MHLSLPLFKLTQWKDKCASYSFTTKKLTHSMCQVSLVVKYIINSSRNVVLIGFRWSLLNENDKDHV